MAGEKRGKALEAIVSLALRRERIARCYNASTMLWDEKHGAMRWKPDFFLDPIKLGDRPSLLVFVTYSGSETDSRQKFWRNLAEFFDAKTQLPQLVTVSVVGGARFRRKLFETQCLLFDSVIDLQELIPSKDLRSLLDHLGRHEGSEDLLSRLDALVNKNNSLNSLVDEIANRIPLNEQKRQLDDSFWKVCRTGGDVRAIGVTHYRRGIAKAALLDSCDRKALRSGKKVRERTEHLALLKYGSLTKSIGGLSLADEEIRFALRNISEDNLAKVLDRGLTASGRDSLSVLRDIPNIAEGVATCAKNWDTVCSPESLKKELSSAGAIPLPASQIFRSLKALLAYKCGLQGQEWIEDVVDETSQMRSILVGLIFPKFERNESAPPPSVVDAMASALAVRCAKFTAPSSIEIEDVINDMIRKEIETKLVCHGIDPVKELICLSAEKRGVPYAEGYLRSGLSEALGFSRKDLGTAGLYLGRNHQTFVHWKTVGPQGRDHKTKELFARGYQSRAELSARRFVRRKMPKNVVLVCDGDWRAGDPEFLASGGWTHVLGVEEIEKVVVSLSEPSEGHPIPT